MKWFASVLILLVVSAPALAADWPAWRGPSGQGFCEEQDVPVTWSDKENVKWKVPLANPGNSTPVVWGDKIFLTQANKGGSERSLLCLARADGKLLWQMDVAYAPKESNWNESWYCNASPALDGERVVVSFGSAGMYCYDFGGKELWKRTDLRACSLVARACGRPAVEDAAGSETRAEQAARAEQGRQTATTGRGFVAPVPT